MKKHDLFKTALEFLKRMQHHLEYVPEVNKFRLHSYRVACEALEQHGSMDGVEKVRGIGKSMLSHFDEIKRTGTCTLLDEISSYGPPYEVRELTALADIGPKKANKLYEEQGITSLVDLEKKIKSGVVTDAKLIQAFYDWKANSARIPRSLVQAHIEPILEICKSVRGIEDAMMAGSYRRFRPDVRDIDVLMRIRSYSDVSKAVKTIASKLGGVPITADGDRKAYLTVKIGASERKLDLNFIESQSWGTAVLHFTGSAKFNQTFREHAKSLGYKVSQYDVSKGTKKHYFDCEEDVFKFFSLPFTPPECRDRHLEVTKEVDVVYEADIIGDLHMHTVDSDGSATAEQLVKSARKQGYKYIGITNHSKSTGNGMTQEQALRLVRQFRKLSDEELRVYAGVELDVKLDGSLDYDKSCLKKFDYVILALHHKPDTDVQKRLEKAFYQTRNIPVILAHPTGRIIGYRSGADIDWTPIFKMCVMNNVLLEINGQGDRCDLPDHLIARAKQIGCKFAVNSDCHSSDLWSTQVNGVHLAMRGLLHRKDIINTSRKRFRLWLESFKEPQND